MTARHARTGTDEIATAAVGRARRARSRAARPPRRGGGGRVARGGARERRGGGTAGADGLAPARVIDADALLRRRSPPAGDRHRGRRRRSGRARHGGGVPRRRAPQPVVGGVTWERRPIDPRARAARRVRDRGRAPARARRHGRRARHARARQRRAVRRVADGRAARRGDRARGRARSARADARRRHRGAAAELGADLVVFLDVGGDALAHGDEPGLASPLCDALLLAAAARVRASARRCPVLGAVFGVGLRRRADTRRGARAHRGGGRGGRPRGRARAHRRASPRGWRRRSRPCPRRRAPRRSAASAARSAPATIRRGPPDGRAVAVGALTFYFDPRAALGSAARLAAAVRDARDLEHGNEHPARRSASTRSSTTSVTHFTQLGDHAH